MNIRSKITLISLFAFGFAGAASAAAETYTIDPVHSSVGFTIRHFVSKVPGSFTKFSGTIKYDEANPSANAVEATIEVSSFSTANEKRDAHVKSPDFLDAEKFTTITFKSTSWKKTADGEGAYDVAGDLTIHGVTKPVVLKTKLLGVGPGMQGMVLSGWEATTVIKKSDFGVSGPAMLSKALGDDVTVNIGIEAGYKK